MNTSRCEVHAGAVVGFSGILRTGHPAEVLVEFSCGCRARTTGPVEVGPFRSSNRGTVSGWDPTSGLVRRGALSMVPVYYTTRSTPAGAAVSFSTRLGDLVDAQTPVLDTAVAALLAGGDVPAPLTVYQDVFRLPPGTGVGIAGGRQRLHHETFDYTGLEVSRRRDRRASALLAEALAEALDDIPHHPIVGVSGGAGSTVVGRVGNRPMVHVHVDLPVLAARRERLDSTVEVIDGTPWWRRICGDALPPYLEELDPWLVTLTATNAGTPVSALGLAHLFATVPGRRQWWRSGWRLLSVAEPPPQLYGKPWWSAWWRPTAQSTNPESADAEPSAHPWLTPQALSTGATASNARIPSHLVAGHDPIVAAIAQRTLDLLDRVEDCRGVRTSVPVLIATHPAVVGAALVVARRNGRRKADQRGLPAALGGLLPEPWRPADPPPLPRLRLLAAAFVQEQLGSEQRRVDLLEKVEDTAWIDAAHLKEVLADPRERLRSAVSLLRLCATVARFPQVLRRKLMILEADGHG